MKNHELRNKKDETVVPKNLKIWIFVTWNSRDECSAMISAQKGFKNVKPNQYLTSSKSEVLKMQF